MAKQQITQDDTTQTPDESGFDPSLIPSGSSIDTALNGPSRTTQPVGPPQVAPGAAPPAAPPTAWSAPQGGGTFLGQPAQPILNGQPGVGVPGVTGGPGSVAQNPQAGPPIYDPQDPSRFINYYYRQEYGTDAPPDQLTYWTNKLNSQELMGNGQVATPDYWATRILRQGVDDLNPPGSQSPSLIPSSNIAGLISQLNSTASGSSAATPVTTGPPADPLDINSVLSALIHNSGTNSKEYTDRVSAARDTLERQRAAELDTARAQLADRGTLGSGPEVSAITTEGQNIAGQFGDQVTQIASDESAKADNRLLTALSLATGLTEKQASDLISQYEAETSRSVGEGQVANSAAANKIQEELGLGGLSNQLTLGLGGLALGNLSAENTYNLGLGNLGLERDIAGNNQDNLTIGDIINILQQISGANNTSAQGHA